ncbi:MAG: SDR family oxidoreductase [Chloroflexota bacterium]|nr:SDR family oxidoreductase [Chloroflexota bacterium]
MKEIWENVSERLDGSTLLGIAALGTVGAGALLRRQRTQESELSGQVALVTGSSRGLGFLLARELAREGCRLVICARDEAELERARADLEQEGAEVLAIPCDLSDRHQVARMVEEATRRFGRVDVLVNNAGIIQVGPLQSLTLQDFEDAFGVMFWGVLYPTLAVLPQMLERQEGRIVNITSIGGKVAVPHLLPYICAKFAAVGLSEALRAELASQGVTVTTIVPGLMRTGSPLNAFFKGQQKDEFTWFSLGSSLPFISMDAERAARQIISAAKRGEAEFTLTLPARLLARFQGLFPGLTANLLGLITPLLLPGPAGTSKEKERGMEVQMRMDFPRNWLLKLLTVLSQRAARRLHQYPGPLSVLSEERERGNVDRGARIAE